MIKSLQRKLFISLSTVLSLTLLIIISFLLIFNLQQLQHQVRNTLQMTLDEVKLKSPFGERNEHSFQTLLVTYDSYNQQAYVSSKNWIIDSETLSELVTTALIESQEFGHIQNDTIAFLKKPTQTGFAIAYLDLNSVNQSKQGQIINSILFFIGGTVIFTLLSYFVTKQITKPVQQALDKQKRFIADASHELKNPLATISANVSILKNNNPNEQVWIDNTNSEIQRMKSLIDRLLFLTNIDSQLLPISMSTVNLSELLNLLVLSQEIVFFEQGKLLTAYIQEDVTLSGNYDELNKLFSILIENAQKYSLEKSETKITLAKNKQQITVQISNPALPLSADDLNHLFDRFYRVDDARDRIKGGYGLGLSMAYEIVKQHHGHITVNQLNNIVTFTVLFKL